MSPTPKQNVAIAIALVFQFCGAIGIIYTEYKNWFISHTTTNLIIMTGLVVYTHFSLPANRSSKNTVGFITVACISCLIGFFSEAIGVNTHLLFGNYEYSNILGYKLLNVPLLIGLQWFVVVYCCGCIVQFVNHWATKELLKIGETLTIKKSAQIVSLLIDAALLSVVFDYFLEPAARKLNYWTWSNNTIPLFNYTCWFFISLLLAYIFNLFRFNKFNRFAIHLFIIQILFFIAITRLYNLK